MDEKILVTFASVHGSTEEVAGAIAAQLQAHGAPVDLLPMRRVRRLDGYRGVVLGAPFYMFQWHNDARRFMSRHQAALQRIPAAVFALGPIDTSEEDLREVLTHLPKEMAKYPWFTPLAADMFGGVFDPHHLRFPYNLIPALKQRPAIDLRDWDAIRAWADRLAPALLPHSVAA